jgi:hypothetical protein
VPFNRLKTITYSFFLMKDYTLALRIGLMKRYIFRCSEIHRKVPDFFGFALFDGAQAPASNKFSQQVDI